MFGQPQEVKTTKGHQRQEKGVYYQKGEAGGQSRKLEQSEFGKRGTTTDELTTIMFRVNARIFFGEKKRG